MPQDHETLPVIESQEGPSPITTDDGFVFFFKGDAEDVELVIMEDRFPPVEAMTKLAGSDIWQVAVVAPSDSLIEYKFAVTRGGRKRTILDPTNPQRAKDPFGSNSVATGRYYESPGWVDANPPRATISELTVQSEVWEEPRAHRVLEPPGYEKGAAGALLVLHDGSDYLDYASFEQCLSALCQAQRIDPPLVLLHQPAHRNSEYPDNQRHISHVLDELLPALASEHSFDRVVAGGASLGGVASISLAYRRPGAIDSLMLQSASLVQALGGPFRRGRVLAPAARLTSEILADPGALPERIVISCGTFDGLVEDHRVVVPQLAQQVPKLSYTEVNAGHHWLCWRDRLEADLLSVLAG